ncbi:MULTISPECIES: hypothetical protein [Arthrobacter]|uniref:Uncharacterized protein n=1 Tax=Arthrobacter terricola TaxID=2547396 RepID=A0A4R5KMP4_9MICC|nr:MULTISPECIES: hypothetical protein [Arthrobacter]MBT8161040.1 hypothetical protein [Arthrobacter sp. GN70]TDF96899.1 hypothetical protein E1809_09260 [Arthrobacter terricola]
MSTEPIIIYGASDDLIEVEGAISEEFDCSGKWEGVLESPDGWRLGVTAKFTGEWEIAVVASGEGWYPDWPIQFTERPDREGDPAVKIWAPEGTTLTEVKG